MDRSGSYQPEAIEADRHALENFYQSNGYLNAKVAKVDIVPDPEDPTLLRVTFHIIEGDIYTISEIKVQGNDIISQEELIERLPINMLAIYIPKTKLAIQLISLGLFWVNMGIYMLMLILHQNQTMKQKRLNLTFLLSLGTR